MSAARVAYWRLGTSADVRPAIQRWLSYLLRYLRRRYTRGKVADWEQAKPLVLGRIRAYQWAQEQMAACQSLGEFGRRLEMELERLARDVNPLWDEGKFSDCYELASRAIALTSVVYLLGNEWLCQSWPESGRAWDLLFPQDVDVPEESCVGNPVPFLWHRTAPSPSQQVRPAPAHARAGRG